VVVDPLSLVAHMGDLAVGEPREVPSARSFSSVGLSLAGCIAAIPDHDQAILLFA